MMLFHVNCLSLLAHPANVMNGMPWTLGVPGKCCGVDHITVVKGSKVG